MPVDIFTKLLYVSLKQFISCLPFILLHQTMQSVSSHAQLVTKSNPDFNLVHDASGNPTGVKMLSLNRVMQPEDFMAMYSELEKIAFDRLDSCFRLWKSRNDLSVESIAELLEDSDPINITGHPGGGVCNDMWKRKGYYNAQVVTDEGNLVWSAILALSHFYLLAAPRSGVFKFLNNASAAVEYDNFVSLHPDSTKPFSKAASQKSMAALPRRAGLFVALHSLIFGFADRTDVPVDVRGSSLATQINYIYHKIFTDHFGNVSFNGGGTYNVKRHRKVTILLKEIALNPPSLLSPEFNAKMAYVNVLDRHLTTAWNISLARASMSNAGIQGAQHSAATDQRNPAYMDLQNASTHISMDLVVHHQNIARQVVFGCANELIGSGPRLRPCAPTSAVLSDMQPQITGASSRIPTYFTLLTEQCEKTFSLFLTDCLQPSKRIVAGVFPPGLSRFPRIFLMILPP